MTPFADELLFDVVSAGLFQAVLAIAFAVPVLLVSAIWRPINCGRFVRRYALFNLFLFGWSALGNTVWLWLTWGHIAVLDDAPVWASFIPFGRYLLDHAAGGPDGWHLVGDTTITHLKVLWAATAIPVWLLTIASMYTYLHTYAARHREQVA